MREPLRYLIIAYILQTDKHTYWWVFFIPNTALRSFRIYKLHLSNFRWNWHRSVILCWPLLLHATRHEQAGNDFIYHGVDMCRFAEIVGFFCTPNIFTLEMLRRFSCQGRTFTHACVCKSVPARPAKPNLIAQCNFKDCLSIRALVIVFFVSWIFSCHNMSCETSCRTLWCCPTTLWININLPVLPSNIIISSIISI